MSFEKGGRADKLGNRYEGWWLVKQLLRILNEEIISLTLEPIGEDEKGAEFWIELRDGRREAHQCKARNAHKEGWSVNELKNKEILKNIRYQLDRDLNHQFVFVSAVSNTLLGDICESARNSTGNPKDFYNHQILKRGKEVQKSFNDFCSALSLDLSLEEDLNLAYHYLKRIQFIYYPDNETTKQDLFREAGFLFTGKPETIFSNLLTYAVENNKFGKPINANHLLDFLETQDIFPKQLAHDKRILPTVKKIQKDFIHSIQPTLIGGTVIKRVETENCIKSLKNDGLVILTGDSGVGKSGVLYEVTNRLEEDGVIYIPVRVDRRVPKNTAEQYGKDIGLPDSPVYCLASIAEGQDAVLIIDQLDAIRWTSNHSSNALDVCKELINQILFFKRQGKGLKVILACRSFDLNFDVELRNWFEARKRIDNFNWQTVEVELLPQQTLQTLIGSSYNDLNNKQKTLLSRPQNLFMWLDIRGRERSNFVSSIDLMRKFWDSKLLDIEEEGILISDVMGILDNLVNFMERKGLISAPNRIVHRNSKKALSALKSNAILREHGDTIIFCHQSYLDFLIAQKVVDSIDRGNSILTWLDNKENQTLFRREQLKQALNMILTEGFFDFPNLVREILFSKDVRFHLKHLVLEIIGHMKNIEMDHTELIIELATDIDWKSHVLETIFYGNGTNIKLLINKKIIPKWLNSEDEQTINIALNLLSSVKEQIPEEINKIINSLIYKDEIWKNRVLNIIGRNIETDSDDIFMVRLKLIEDGLKPYYINWSNICSLFPMRAIECLESILKSYKTKGELGNSKYDLRVEQLYAADLKSLTSASEKNCLETWDKLMFQLERLLENNNEEAFNLEWIDEFGEYDVFKGTAKLIISAGKKMARDFPIELINRVKLLNTCSFNTIKFIICESYMYLAPEYADVGIEWFIENSSIVMQDYNMSKPKYHLARQLVKSLSVYCSDSKFRELEKFFLYYHVPNEKELAQRYLEYRKEGYLHYYWGEVQYLLLTKLDQKRISKEVSELIAVLKRRYYGKSDDIISNRSSRLRGGIVSSKLAKNLFKISDNAWMKIIVNKSIPRNQGRIWDEAGENSLLESSIGQFSRSLEKVAEHDPNRFGRLAIKFPLDVAPQYITSILRSFELKEFSSQNINKEDWEPASPQIIIEVLNKHLQVKNREIAMAFCRLIRVRDDVNWSDEILDKLAYTAVYHSDPELDKMNIHPADWDNSMDSLSASDLFDNSINCVRGVAVEAIGNLLWNNPKIFDKFRDTIESIINDPHPSVRISAVGMLLPVLNIDRDRAVEWFAHTTKKDLRTICTNDGKKFVNYTIRSHTKIIGDLIFKMTESKYDEVVKLGSEMVAAYYIIHNLFIDKYQTYIKGSIPQRQGIVSASTSLIDNMDYAVKCAELLEPFIDEYDQNVSKEMSELFRHDLVELKENMELIIKYIKSPYLENDFLLIHMLEEYKGSLLEFSDILLNLCNEVCTKHYKESRDFSSQFMIWATELPKLLLRIYEESMEKGQRSVFNSCLDMWDNFFENRVGSVRELTKIVENEK
ncbi:AAA family ATPase [Priestia megaterium]|uniref:AAA family ATPase n=1 Tax=Priestia megaterium TaxID=1404 RepID=UPI001C52A52A|nr:ATP-binding protein [Priestia megaterium]MBW0933538.1 ATP-binding protein [Priestia megaterium]